jgi:6-phosphogluconolactonase
MTAEIEIVNDPARACAAMLVGAAAGGGDVVLTGGSTPRAAYEELVKAVGAVELDMTKTTFWFGDERCLPPDDDRSNYRLAKESLIDPLGADNQPIVHRMKGELGPSEGADDYEQALRNAGPPRFELLLLGLGPDGHCASLFPDQPTLQERDRLVVGVEQAGLEPYVPRISLTLPALSAARRVLFLVTGSSKAEAVAKAFGPGATADPHVPASMLVPLAEEVTVLLDPAAAARL